jgi:uncharacterized protein YjbJ (UPF0337 family)
MGEHTDKITGRFKQAVGALKGDHDLKHGGERQERKGEVKGHINHAVDKAQDAAACSAPGLSRSRLTAALS